MKKDKNKEDREEEKDKQQGRDEDRGEDLEEQENPFHTYTQTRPLILSRSIPMSLQFARNKAKMGNEIFYMTRVKKRVRGAVRLVVQQGTRVVQAGARLDLDGEGSRPVKGKGKEKLIFDLEEVKKGKELEGGGWVLRGALLLSIHVSTRF